MEQKLKIGITQGDINGISYEVILKALADQHIQEHCTPIIYGSAKAASFHKKSLEIDSYTISVSRSAQDVNPHKISIINTSEEEPKVDLGQATPEAGKSAFDALEAATKDLLQGNIDAIVTAPINKASIQSEQFHFPGHTEYLESKTDNESLMILACRRWMQTHAWHSSHCLMTAMRRSLSSSPPCCRWTSGMNTLLKQRWQMR